LWGRCGRLKINTKVLVSHMLLISTLFYALYIFIVSTSSTAPGAETGKEVTPYFSYIAHYVLYFGFSYFIFVTFKELKKYPVKPYLFTIISASLYGLFIEIIQYFLPYRHFSFLDIGINVLGAISLVAIVHKFQSKNMDTILELLF